MFDLHSKFSSSVEIASIEAFTYQGHYLVRTRSTEGAEGIVTVNNRLKYLYPIMEEYMLPFFIGQDARDLESLVDGIYTYRSSYKLAGIGYWNPVAYIELSLLDMLGKIAGKPVSVLIGPVLRNRIPVYLSSLRRDTTPEEEVAWLGERLEETGADAIKIKIGGRMSRNADAFPGRSEGLVSLARKTFGDDIAIYVDANGSYDAPYAIEVGGMLTDWGVAIYEEPCPWQEYEWTKQVADALDIPVAGGEQDSSLPHFRWMIRERGVDIVQTDVMYSGGMTRLMRVAEMAQAVDMPIMPHSPKVGAESAAVLHFAAVAPNLGPYQEYYGPRVETPSWYTPDFSIREGCIEVPTEPGLGVHYDPSIWESARPLF